MDEWNEGREGSEEVEIWYSGVEGKGLKQPRGGRMYSDRPI